MEICLLRGGAHVPFVYRLLRPSGTETTSTHPHFSPTGKVVRLVFRKSPRPRCISEEVLSMVDNTFQFGHSPTEKLRLHSPLLRPIPVRLDQACPPLGGAPVDRFHSFHWRFGDKTPRLSELESVRFIQCNLKFILQYLQFPNVNSFDVQSHGINSDGEPDLPSSGDVGYFAPLQALPIPVLDKHIVAAVMVHMVNYFTDSIYFKLFLQCGASRTFGFTGAFRKEGDWEAYFNSSVNEILRRTRLGTTVGLSASHHVPLSPIDSPLCQSLLSWLDLPLLRLPQVALLRTDSSLTQNMIIRLADLEHRIPPNLKCYSSDVKTQPTFVDLAAPETLARLRSRFTNGSPFA